MDILKLVEDMTIDEKCSLLSGLDFWQTKAVERLQIPQIMVSDGPHGLRTQKIDENGKLITLEATCFPSASALGCSWDTDLCYEVGKAMGEEALDFGVSIILGPGVNIKRSPLCGRNFEYYSEDPVLTGEMAAGLINGIQSIGIGTCIKHFAVNNQEYRRLSVDACLSQKALFDIYLKNFEIAIKKSKPFSVMCSYNRINGQYACESKTLLTDILRNLWGFDGIVVSDWGATNDRINCLKAGMELEMPGSGGINDMKVAQAVKAGLLDEEVLNTGVLRLLKLIYKCHENKKDFKANFEEHHLLARKAAAQSAVLLKNDNLLPIKAKEKICVIGEFAKITRYQGGGSSHIISTKIDNAYDEIVKINQLSNSNEIKYAIGYKIDEPKTDYNLIENALQIAEGCDKIVVFAGLPDSFESEGYDRKTLEIPQCQNDLITALCQKNKNVIVVLYNGAPIVMPWKNQVGAILTCYLAGQAVGGAVADLLFGKSVPCGKLSETYPEKIEDTPCFLSFPGYMDSSIYTEDIFVGYRYYDKKKIQPAFSFGFGLSYSSFEYSNFKISSNTLKENEKITVSFVIKNVGDFDANEIVQLYSGKSNPKFSCCEKDLKAFKKVFIKKGESICVDMLLSFDDLAEYNNADKRVVTESGDYKIIIASSSRNEDIKFKDKINVVSNFKESYIFHRNSTILDLVSNPKGKEIFDKIVKNNPEIIDMVFNGMEDDGSSFKQEMINNTTLRSLVYFSMGKFSEEMLENLLEEMK